MNPETVLQRASDVLRIESDGLLAIAGRLDKNFVTAVELLESCAGKVVVTGMGKSGLICRKIAATLASTGTPAFFLHAADALHGDVGMIKQGDVVLAISNSGETDEILKLLPHIRHHRLKLVVMTGNLESTLAKAGDVVLDIKVPEEACPLGLAPTASTTAALAMGDALAVVVLERKGFKEEDFALRHPGGILGRRLLLRVEELMHRGEELPVVREKTLMKEALFEITSKRLGIVGVVNAADSLVGVVTDGDLRRGLQKHGEKILNKRADELMTPNPRTIAEDALASEALVKMEDPERPITALFVLEKHSQKPIGVIHIHDILKAGL